MQVSEENGKVCVSLDVASVFTSYKDEVTTYTATQTILKPNLSNVLLLQKPINDVKLMRNADKDPNLYKAGD